MTDTDTFQRFERVTAVGRPSAGCWRSCTASSCGSTSSATDVCGSRSAGAECSTSPRPSRSASTRWPSAPSSRSSGTTSVVRLRTSALVVSLWLDPFRLDVHRTDGSPVVETARGRRGSLLGLRHAERRVHGPAPVPPGGRVLRPRREDRPPQPQGPRLHAVEHRRARPPRDRRVHRRPAAGRPALGPDEHGVRPLLRVDPVLLPPRPIRRSDGGVVRRQRLPRARTTSPRPRNTAIHFAGGQYTEYVFAGPDMPRDPGGVHLADRTHRAAAAVGARIPPVPLVPLHAGRRRGRSPGGTGTHDIPCDALWLDIEYMDGYRVFTWDTEAFPDVAGMLARLTDQGFRVITIVDPGRQVRPRLLGLRPGGRARRAVQDRGRRRLHRSGLAGQHRVPGLRHRGGARLVGRAQRGARAVRPGRHLERHERAGHRRHPAGRACGSATGSTRTSATTTSTRC